MYTKFEDLPGCMVVTPGDLLGIEDNVNLKFYPLEKLWEKLCASPGAGCVFVRHWD